MCVNETTSAIIALLPLKRDQIDNDTFLQKVALAKVVAKNFPQEHESQIQKESILRMRYVLHHV